MDEIFGVMEGNLKVSIADSTMMWIVHRAMDKAHERVKSKDGILERLNEISKFYELAVIQLEGCVKFVQEETETSIVESNHEELLSGLADIRNRLRDRLRESELAISDKDRELTERLDNESRLRQIIEEKERELADLRENLEIERSKSENELKNSVDDQVLNINHRVEVDDERYHGVSDEEVDQMGSDIDVLKETLDFAFGKMQNAILASEILPIEQQFRSSVEKNTLSILLKGFMADVKESCEAEMRSSFFLGDYFSNLIREITSFRDDLEFFADFEWIKMEETKLLEGHKFAENLEEREEDGSHYVAKMIKNHESIIRKKSKEAEVLNRLRQEILREKSISSSRGEKDLDTIQKRIQEFLVKLEKSREILMGKKLEEFGEIGRKEPCFLDIPFPAGVWPENEEKDSQIIRLSQEKEDSEVEMMLREEIYMTILEGLIDNFFDVSQIPDQTSAIENDVVMVLFREMIKEWEEGMRNFNIERQIKQQISKWSEELELLASEKLGMIILRLEELKNGFNPVAKIMHSVRESEALYKKAFINRCQNLQKAEIEVDLLGDQVDSLACLLEKIYFTLHHFSPVLQQHFDVSDMLEKMKKELWTEK